MIFFGWPAHLPTKASGRILLLHCSRPPEIVIQNFRKRFENFDFFSYYFFSVERGKDLKICWVCTVSSLAIITSETPRAACIWKDDKGVKTETEICPEQIGADSYFTFLGNAPTGKNHQRSNQMLWKWTWVWTWEVNKCWIKQKCIEKYRGQTGLSDLYFTSIINNLSCPLSAQPRAQSD